MAVLKIRTFGDPVLRQSARSIAKITETHRRLAADMIDTMRAAPGVGLAGPQVGVLERIFVWEVDDDFGVVINPLVTARSAETEVDEEGCLSLPGVLQPVERSLRATIEGVDDNGVPVLLEADDLLARVCQHEIDHLDGVLLIDRIPDEQRKEALRTLRELALGLTPVTAVPRPPREDAL
ncbi:peptide deformylase [soil metagenome]